MICMSGMAYIETRPFSAQHSRQPLEALTAGMHFPAGSHPGAGAYAPDWFEPSRAHRQDPGLTRNRRSFSCLKSGLGTHSGTQF